MIDGAERADPATEESSQEHRGNQDEEAVKQSLIESMACKCVRQTDQRIESEKEAYWVW
jgi:hypothetical protein